MMAKRSARTQELREKGELSCMSGLFSILDSHQGCASPELISNGRPANELIIDYSRKLDHRTSFDEACRRIQYEPDLASIRVNSCERSLWDLIRDDMHIEMNRNKESINKGRQWTETDSQLIDHLLDTRKAAAKKSRKANQSNLHHSLIHQPSTSAEISLNKLATGTVCSQNHREEVRLPQGYRRSVRLGKHEQADEKSMENAQMSAKAFVDHTLADRKLICKKETRIESKPFSDALEVLSTDKDLFMELLSEPNLQLENCIKNVRTSQTAKETIKSVLDAKLSKCGCQDKYSGKFACRCSSRQSLKRSNSKVSNGKHTSFSVREIKQKLKHSFGGTRKEPNQFSVCGTSSKLSRNRSVFGDDCIYSGVDARNPLNSSANSKTNEKLGKKQSVKLEREPDIARETDTVRKKIDVSSGRLPSKHAVDAVLEANRRLAARLTDTNAIGTTSERSPKTVEMIISSLEHDCWPLSPRRDSLYWSGSGQMRFNCYSTSHTPNDRQRTCLSPLRIFTEVTSCDDYKEYDDTTDILSREMSSSMVPSTDEEAQDTMSSPTGNMKSNDEPNIAEMDNIRHSEAQNEINNSMQRSDKMKLHEQDDSVMHTTSDALSYDETFTNTADDFPSTPTSIHHLDMPESSKYQEEHQSPVSVLDQFFAEDASSPSSSMLQPARDRLKPRRLHFEECSTESSPRHDQDYISHYVHLVFKASSLNWDQLSKIRPLSEELLLHPSLFDEVQFLLSDSHIDTTLLFDHMNEVLLKIQQSHVLCLPWTATEKPRICSVPLEEVVVDEIMREADFYLLPLTQRRTLDQLVSKDTADSTLWLDLRPETEHIIIHISEDIMEESILNVILEIHC